MPVENNHLELRIGHVDSAMGSTKLLVTLVVDAYGQGTVRLHAMDVTSRRTGEMLVLDSAQYADFLNVIHAAHQQLERLQSTRQMRPFLRPPR